MRSLLLLLVATATPVFSAAAQVAGRDSVYRSSTLTLDEAITLARRNNYLHLVALSNRRSASAGLRTAYGQLLPQADASLTGQRQEGGRQIFNGGEFGASSDVNQSQYRVGISYRVNGATLMAPTVQRANRDAVEADISSSDEGLRSRVALQYLTVLQTQARADLQDTLVNAAKSQLVLAQARAIVGMGTQLDVSRAEIALGQQQVQQINLRNQVEIDKLKLFQEMGVPKPDVVNLTSRFVVTPAGFALGDLLQSARRQNPTIMALRARERVAGLAVRQQKSEYTPTLSLSTGFSGYTYQYTNPNFIVEQSQAQAAAERASCTRTEEVRAALGLSNRLALCGAIGVTDEAAAALRRANDPFPFDFTRSPRAIAATLSLPLFDGFAREQRVQEAQLARDRASNLLRASEISLTSDITAAYLTLTTSEKTVALQEQNSNKARAELKLMQDRYRVGMATFIDLTEARSAYERAESDRINAVYDYHKAFAILENAVGRPLR